MKFGLVGRGQDAKKWFTRSNVDEIAMLLAQNLGNWLPIYEDMVPRYRFRAMLRTAGRQGRFLAYLGTWGQFWTILYSYESVE